MNQKFRFTAEPRSALCLLSMALMLLSAAARLWYYLADPVATAMTLSQADIFLLVGLPVFSAALYPVLLALFGRRTIVPLTAPVAGFVVFFLYKALSFSSVLHTVLCSILYLAVLVFFLLTALGVDWPVVVENYLITNERMAASTDCLLTAVKDYDLTEAERDVIRTFDCADVEFLTAARDAAEARYGSMDAFLSQALGVGEAEREILRARWLTE